MARKKTKEPTLKETLMDAELRLVLRQAAHWQHAGQLYQALDAYTQVMTQFAESDAARTAKEHVQEIARVFEECGRYHQALSIYQRLAEFESQEHADAAAQPAPHAAIKAKAAFGAEAPKR
ncbi:MAG: hypothetical protein HY741_07740 [Chloroflexi bacterium]|nr:hypothetical protein [Chloroflexota bacterium]